MSQPLALGSTPECSRSYIIALCTKSYIIMCRLCRRVRYWTSLAPAQIIWYRIVVCLLNHELERVWKETDVTGFEVLSRYLPGGTEKIREESRYDSVCPSPRFETCTWDTETRNVMAWNKLLGVNYYGTYYIVLYLFIYSYYVNYVKRGDRNFSWSKP
jgi:hypothetical protein